MGFVSQLSDNILNLLLLRLKSVDKWLKDVHTIWLVWNHGKMYDILNALIVH